MTPAPTPSFVTGLFVGLVTVIFWSLYNVGAKIGQIDGFNSIDLVALRLGVGGLALVPVALTLRRPATLTPLRLAVLCVASGPLFAFLLAQGFRYAPLGHGLVLAPCTSMAVANLLAWRLDGERPGTLRLIGMGTMLLSLILIAADAAIVAPREAASPATTALGDMFFVMGATFWGVYTYLVGRWRLPPLQTAAGVAALSAVVTLPPYLAFAARPDLPARLWLEQAFYQGLCGGALAFVGFAITIAHLGAARASMFFALVPPAATIAAVPLMHTVPSGLQTGAIAIATAGITLSLLNRS